MKVLQSKIFWGLIIVFLAGGGYLFLRPQEKVHYITAQVKRQKLVRTVSVTGTVKGASEIDLNFESPGVIKRILVAKGDKVEAGELLAELRATTERSAVAEAKANLAAARAQLNKLLAGATPEELEVARERVKNAEITYNNKVKDLENLRKKLATDEKNYYDRVDSTQVDLADAKSNAIVTVKNELFDGESALNRVDSILTNDDAKYTLSAQNSSLLPQAKDSYKQAQAMIAAAKDLAQQAEISDNYDDIIAVLDEALDALTKVADTLSLTYAVLVNTPASSRYTQTEIDLDKTNIKNDQATISASISSMQSSKTSLTAAQSSLVNAENTLATFLASKDSQLQAAEGAVESAKGAWQLAQAELALKEAKARPEDIALQQARVAQAEAALARAQARLEQMMIYSPTDGTITKVHYEEGEKVEVGMPVISMIGESGLEIEVDVPETDITKVKVGNEAVITLDAYGDDLKFKGTVVFIDPAETVIQDVVYYKVKVSLVDIEKYEIKPGMTANVDIITAVKDNVLVVPARAVKQNDTKYVEVLEGGVPQKREVKVGLKGDGGLIEIISGLKEGEEVVTFVNNKR